jgi:hypothetical protein
MAYMGCATTSRSIAMSGGQPAVDKNRPIEDATRAGEPDSVGRLPLRRDVNPAVIGVSLAETAETPSRACGGDQIFDQIGVSLAGIAEIHSQAPNGVLQ